jgi:hypothetical protein
LFFKKIEDVFKESLLEIVIFQFLIKCVHFY